MLPADSHVHSEWSWDAPGGSMERTCERAVEIGLPALAFTEHLDHTVWTVEPEHLVPYDHLTSLVEQDGRLVPPAFDVMGYLAELEQCRERFPSLRILSGAEVGEPHWHAEAVADVLAAGPLDRVLGSLHCLPLSMERDGVDGFAEPPGLFARRPAPEVLREYFAEVCRLVAGSEVFTVLAHVDYPLHYWPASAGPFVVGDFEEEIRHALRCTAQAGKVLEINTKVPLPPVVVGWWREEGGQAVTFASDSHVPEGIAHGFREAAAYAEAHGFRAGAGPEDLWHLT